MNNLSDLISDQGMQQLRDKFTAQMTYDCTLPGDLLDNFLFGFCIQLTGEPCSITQFRQNTFTAFDKRSSELLTMYMTASDVKETVLGDNLELKYILLSRLTRKLFKRMKIQNDITLMLYMNLVLCSIPINDMSVLMPDGYLFSKLSKIINNQMIHGAWCYDELISVTEYISAIKYSDGYFVDMSVYIYVYLAAMLNIMKLKRREYLSSQLPFIQLTRIYT